MLGTRAQPEPNFTAELRSKDYEYFLLALASPISERENHALILSLLAELAAIKKRVTEPLMGQIRTVWWREQIAALNPANPLLAALLPLLQQHPSLTAPIHQIIDGFEAQWQDPTATLTLPQMAVASDQIWGSLAMLFGQMTNRNFDHHQCQRVGTAYGICRLLTSHHNSGNPSRDSDTAISSHELAMAASGYALTQLKRGNSSQPMPKTIKAMRTITKRRLQRLRDCNYQVSDRRLTRRDPLLPLRLLFS